MSEQRTIRQAVPADLAKIASFLSGARYVHQHLDWRTPVDWIGSQPYVLLEESERITGLLSYPEDPPGISWIRCFATATGSSPSIVWEQLFSETLKLQQTQKTVICALGLQEWFASLLLEHNFTHFQDIVVLLWDRKGYKPRPLPAGFTTRRMTASDVEAVAVVDQNSFEALWVNSAETLRLALQQSDLAEVLEYEGAIVGYQICTANLFSAHLARLAVLPDFQRHGLGSNLVSSIFEHYRQKNIDQVTVNTQRNNVSSLTLYRKMGFEITDEHYPILVYNR
jgi:ribosomal protein S18 acetylase RimI-like enzyme